MCRSTKSPTCAIPAPVAPCLPDRATEGRARARPSTPALPVPFLLDFFAQALNGLSYGVLLFLLSVGVALIFGMLDVVNLAHGSFYMLGSYAVLTLIAASASFWLALAVPPLVVGVVGV